MDRSEDEERNYYCLLLILMRVGTAKLRDYFIRKWDSASACHRRWSDCPQDGADLMLRWKPRILHYETDKVKSGNTLRWDLSLFVKILSRKEPRKGCIRALDKLKDLRNILCHTSEAKLTNHDFQTKWNDACNALVIFGAMKEDFKRVKEDAAKQPMGELKPVVVNWLAQEFELLHNGQQQLLQTLVKLEQGQFTLFEKISELKDMQQGTTGATYERDSSLNQTLREATQTMLCEDKGLATYLKGYYRTGERALLLPFSWINSRGDQFHMEGIYTPTNIVETYMKGKVPLEKIFVKAATSPNNIRSILIEGENGIGKSTICKKIAYDWSMNNTPLSFPTFELVLSLRCLEFHAGLGDLWDAIEMQSLSDDLKENKDEIFKYIKTNQTKVLLILDGYDEISEKSANSMKQSIKRLLHGQLLPHCHIIVTSRPEKDAEIRNHFDRKLEIQGFELENALKYIRHFYTSAPENVDPINTFIENDDDVRELVRSPLHTAILCLKHNEELNLSKEIVFSIIKRYCVEKLGEQVDDDELQNVMDDQLYNLRKKAFTLVKEDRGSQFPEKEFLSMVNPSGLIAFFVVFFGVIWIRIRRIFCKESLGEKVETGKMMKEFLTCSNPENSINTDPNYAIPYWALQKHLAADYVIQSFVKNYYVELGNILAFKDMATFLRVVSFIYFVLKRCFKEGILSWRGIVSNLLLYLFLYIRFGYDEVVTRFVSESFSSHTHETFCH